MNNKEMQKEKLVKIKENSNLLDEREIIKPENDSSLQIFDVMNQIHLFLKFCCKCFEEDFWNCHTTVIEIVLHTSLSSEQDIKRT